MVSITKEVTDIVIVTATEVMAMAMVTATEEVMAMDTAIMTKNMTLNVRSDKFIL